jgi:hydrogenase expression/formation protein HypE
MADAKISSFSLNCPVPRVADDRIVLAHGGGGRLTHQLIEKIFMPAFSNDMLEQRHDGAVLPINGSHSPPILSWSVL